SLFAIVLLPRQFHVTVVENQGEAEIRRAAWLFPLYLVLINLFVVPVAIGGLLTFPHGSVDTDMFVLALPLAAGAEALALAAFVGGLSAATAMVIVECVALAIMVSNDIFIPLVLRRRGALLAGQRDIGTLLLTVRRIAIPIILSLAYLYYRSAGDAQLASIGLLSFAAIAQLAPAFFGGLIWRHATARGALVGMIAGVLVWAYTLLLPSIVESGIIDHQLLAEGPLGLALLRPQALLGLELPPLVHGVLWSLALNVAAYIAFSLQRKPVGIEQLQANLFVPPALEPAFRRNLGPAAGPGPGRNRTRRNRALQRRARRTRPGSPGRTRCRARREIRIGDCADPGTQPRSRGGGALQSHAGRRPGDDAHRHHS